MRVNDLISSAFTRSILKLLYHTTKEANIKKIKVTKERLKKERGDTETSDKQKSRSWT